MKKQAITLCIFLGLIVSGWYSTNKIVEYRQNRYQSCAEKKAETIKNIRAYQTIRAKEDKYYQKRFETVEPYAREMLLAQRDHIYASSPVRARIDFVNSDNSQHPCDWVDGWVKVGIRSSRNVGSGSY